MGRAITENKFGEFEGKPVTEFKLTNRSGMQLAVMNYGATVTRIMTPGRDGKFVNVIIGYESLAGYLQEGNPYNGCIAGRYCNRIANARFMLDGIEYQVTKNHGPHHLHGGLKGFDKVFWQAKKDEQANAVIFSYSSADGEEGFPGKLLLTVTYTLSDADEVRIEYHAVTDKPTPVNLTNHCYFNLSGNRSQSIWDHELKLYAHSFTAVDATLIPTGEITAVENTPFDFTSLTSIGEQVAAAGGYDHNFVLDKMGGNEAQVAAELYHPPTGRMMKMFTTEPAVQFYSGPLDDSPGGQHGLCLEAQHYPDSPNHPEFPDTILRPGEAYTQLTSYRFSVLS